MKKTIFTLFTFLFLSSYSYSETVVAEVGDEKITFEQIEKAYNKNPGINDKSLRDLDLDSVLNYVDLYVDYRLKVLDAIDKGYLDDPDVLEEIQTNRRLLAESFYYENELMRPRINEIVERRKNEYRFAFIIVPFDNADPSTHDEKREKAQEALDSIKNGMKFSVAANKYSEDARTRAYGGEVDTWVTGGSIQKPLEDVFFGLEPGEVYDDIIETPYGCFVVKLLEREKRKILDLSHILVADVSDFSTVEDSTLYINKADSIINAINNGADFKTLANNYSKDVTTAYQGGSFGADYSRSTGFLGSGAPLTPKIIDIVYSLEPGEISEKVFTPQGLHIFKLNESKGIDKEKEYEVAKDVYKKVFYQKDKKLFMDSIARSFGFELNTANVEKFQAEVDTNRTTIGEGWAENLSTDTKSLELFKFNDKTYKIIDFINSTVTRKDLRGFQLTDDGIRKASRKMIGDELFDLATKELESKYPEYKALLMEFRDGIILFKAEDEEVWSKREVNEDISKAYWDSTKSNYRSDYRFEVTEVYRLNETSINEIKTELDNGGDIKNIAELRTQRDGYREKQGYMGWIEKGKNNTADIIPIEEAKKGAIIGPYKNKFGWSVLKIHDMEEPKVLPYEEAEVLIRPAVQNIIQQNLRDAWLARVEKKHPVKIKENNIKEIIN